MGGTSAAMMLHRMIHDAFGWRGEFQVCESLQMCAADRVSPSDVEEAYACGRRAVELAAGGHVGRDGQHRAPVRASPIAGRWAPPRWPRWPWGPSRCPIDFINAAGNHVTEECLEYLRPLVGELPEYVRLIGGDRT